MKKYQLIKKLPFEGSPPIGYISVEIEGEEGAHYWNYNWFHPEDYPEYWKKVEEILPLAFIYEGLYYTKELDGVYHIWANPQQRQLFLKGDKTQNPLGTKQVNAVRSLIEDVKYTQTIPYFTNSVNNKL